jgi:hypothetical protein
MDREEAAPAPDPGEGPAPRGPVDRLGSADAGAGLIPRWLPFIVAAALAPAFVVKVKSYDVWWHMATGRWMVENGRLPTTDPFTYTMAGKPWHTVDGIAALVFYGAYRLGAETGLILLKVFVAFLTLALLGLCLRELRVSRGGLVGLLVAIAVLLHGRFTMDRPLILGGALLAGSLLAIVRSHERHDRSHLFLLAALPLWPLVHPTALLGFMTLGALLVASVAARPPSAGISTPHGRSIALTFAACVALAAALPWWRDAIVTATHLTGGATATTFTAEWRSGTEALGERVGHWAFVAAAILGGVRRLRRNAALLLLSLLAAAISYEFARNAYEGVILAAPACACALEDGAAWLRASGSALLGAALPPIAALAIAVVQVATAPVATISGPFGFGVEKRLFPYDTLETLRRLPPGHVMNGFAIGGFLIWQKIPFGVYCDGRTVALYQEDDVRRLFLPMIEGGAALTRAADTWEAVYGLNENLSPPNQWMMVSPDWVPLHIGLGTTLFARSTALAGLPPSVRPLHLVRYTTDTAWTAGWYEGILKDPALVSQLVDEFGHAATLSPDSPLLVDILRVVASESPRHAAALEEILVRARGGS